MSMGVYTIVNTINKRIYVGSSVNVGRRILRHINLLGRGVHENGHLQSAWNKYGEYVFKFKQIYSADTLEIARGLEQKLLDLWTPRGLYNIAISACGAAAGENNHAKRPEVRQKISNTLRGRRLSAKAKIKLGIAIKNVWAVPEHKTKMSEIHKMCWANPIQRQARCAAMKGPRERVLCPHCDKVGGKGNMHRYHFDNCKQRK